LNNEGGVKHSPLPFTQDCKIELGKVGEFVTPLPPKKNKSMG